MTAVKPREPGSFPDATTIISAALSAKSAGEVIETGPGRVYAASDPDQPNYSPFNLVQALKLDVAYRAITGQHGPLLRAYQRQYDELTHGVPAVEAEPLEIVANVTSKSNAIVQGIIQSKKPDSDLGADVSPREALEIIRGIDEAQIALEVARRTYAKAAGVALGISPNGVTNILSARAS